MRTSEDQIYDMSIKQTQTVATQAVIGQKLHPGFQCFFKNYLDSKSITFNECFNRLIEGAQNLAEIKYSIPNIFNMKGNTIQDRKKLLMPKDNKYLYIYKNELGMKTQLINYTQKQQQNIHMLERRLIFYKQNKRKLLAQKFEQFTKDKVKKQLPDISNENQSQKAMRKNQISKESFHRKIA